MNLIFFRRCLEELYLLLMIKELLMLKCEGYKMFRGVGEIHNVITGNLITQEYGDWLYKPEYDCWYVNGKSYPSECLSIVEDQTEIKN